MTLAERVALEGTLNTRDLGGMVGAGGKRIKKGLLLRSDAICALTHNDVEKLSKEYSLGWDIDLRSDSEVESKPDTEIPGCTKIRFPVSSKVMQRSDVCLPPEACQDPDFRWLYRRLYSLSDRGDAFEGMAGLYRHYVDMDSNRKSFAEFIRFVAEADKPLLYHCADGKDRTGMATAYLLSILGVDREAILADYEVSFGNLKVKSDRRAAWLRSLGISDENLIVNLCMMASVRRAWLEAAFEDIDVNYGGFASYLRDILGIGDETVAKLRGRCLE